MVVLVSLSKCLTPSSLHLQKPGYIPRVNLPLKRASCIVVNKGQCERYTLCSSRMFTADSRSIKACASNDHEEVVPWPHFKSSVVDQLTSFYQFSSPHSTTGTIIGVISASLLPVQTMADLSPLFFAGLLKVLLPSVLMNIYVSWLNQLFDVEIDKVNKPHFPLASGRFSMRTGVTIASASLLMSLGMAIVFQSPPILYGLIAWCVIGSVYSVPLPLLRWKKNAFLAAICIIIMMAFIVPLTPFVHIQESVLGKPIVITRELLFTVTFMCLFSTVLAIFKDIPDVEGDKAYGVQSLCAKLGKERTFWLCIKTLLVLYGASIAVGACSSSLPNKFVTILGHSALAFILRVQAKSVDLTSNKSINSFYMFLWKLHYAENFLIHFVR